MIEFCMILLVWLLGGSLPFWAQLTITIVCVIRFGMQVMLFTTALLKQGKADTE